MPSRRSVSVLALAASAILVPLVWANGVSASSSASAQDGTRDQERTGQQDDRDRKRDERDRSKRLAKLDRADRAALEAVLDFAAPEFTPGLDWIGNAPKDMKSLRGKVVVLQTFATRGAARTLPERAAKALKEFGDEVVLIAIHIPEGADKAAAALEKADPSMPVAIDRDGAFCDAIGAFKEPVNVVVNRTGEVKAAGLTLDGLALTVGEFVAVPYDPADKPTERKPETSKTSKGFPVFKEAVSSAIDLRGKPSPSLPNVDWWNVSKLPAANGRLVIVDFWATWCGPCRAAIPHMNEIAQAFSQDVMCIGLSDESQSKFEEGTRKHDLKKSTFQYPVGVDPSGAMKKGFGITGIPHIAVISKDGIVRWQGHPMSLSNDVLRQLIEANKGLEGTGEGGSTPSARWKRDLADAGEQPKGRRERKSY